VTERRLGEVEAAVPHLVSDWTLTELGHPPDLLRVTPSTATTPTYVSRLSWLS
jgi:hypothetical protein